MGTFSSIKMNDLAKEAVDLAMVDSNLNTEIAKIARREELNGEQIQRVVEQANHDAFARTYKVAEDKRFEFPIATKEAITKLLNPETEPSGGGEKKASAEDDFYSLKKFDKGLSKIASSIPVNQNRYLGMGGTTALKQAMVHLLGQCQTKLAQYRRDIQAMRTESFLEMEQEGAKLASEVRRLMLEDGHSIRSIYSAAMSIMPKVAHPMVAFIFKKIAADLTKTTKLANAAEDEILKQFDSSDWEALGGRQVDGNQPLFIHLKPCVRALFTYSGYGPMCDSCDKSTSGIVTAIHNLKTNDDVREYISNEVQPFAYNVRKGIKFAMQYIIDHAEDDTWLAKTAGFMDIFKTLMPSMQVAQVLNQLIRSGGATKNAVTQFFSDLTSPANVRTGTSMVGQLGK